MTKLFVKEYFLKQKQVFLHNYKIAIKTRDVDAVHDMRVAVKRLNSTVRMLNFKERTNFRLKKSFRPLRFVYKQFGKIRDYQVLNGLIVKLQDKVGTNLKVLANNCEYCLQKEIDLLLTKIRYFRYLAIKRNFKLIERYIELKGTEMLVQKVLLYYEDRMSLLKFYSDKLNEEHDLHEARKMIKDIGYLMEMSAEVLTDFVSELKKYKELGSILGRWHDRDVLLDYLRLNKNELNLNKTDYDKAMAEISKEKEELENKYYLLTGF